MIKKEIYTHSGEERGNCPSVRHLTFRREDGRLFSFIPGQFITLHILRRKRFYDVVIVLPIARMKRVIKYILRLLTFQKGQRRPLIYNQVGDKVTEQVFWSVDFADSRRQAVIFL